VYRCCCCLLLYARAIDLRPCLSVLVILVCTRRTMDMHGCVRYYVSCGLDDDGTVVWTLR
jgi:hypothetical protein